MRFEANKTILSLALLVVCCVSQWKAAECYKTEVEFTPAPIEEPTTKKSGFFSGFKSFFGGTTTTTTLPVLEATTPKSIQRQTPAPVALPAAPASTASGQKPPPLVIPHAPLMPLGPRPDTPPSSPVAGHAQQPPQWPQAPQTSSTTAVPPAQPFPASTHGGQGAATTAFGSGQQRPSAGQPQPNAGQQQPNLPPGFAPYRPPKGQPSGLDLSYGGGGRPQGNSQPGFGLAPLTSSTTTTTTTSRSVAPQSPMNFDLRMGGDSGTTSTARPQKAKEDFPPLPAPRRPSVGAKEDFPPLSSTPRSPISTPSSPLRPPSPSAAQPASPSAWRTTTPAGVLRPGSPVAPVPHPAGGAASNGPKATTTTTARAVLASAGGNSVATDDEIRQLTENLYTKEVNSQLNLIRINPQGRTRSIDSTDEAPQPLLEVDAKALQPTTIAKMRLLFNNYELDTSVNEYVTPNERKEENDFLDAVMATSVMRQAMLFLQNKGIVTADPKTHRDLVKELWFTQYSRGKGKIGSSGFEHVFVNEVKEGTIIGLHNWVYFFDEEKAGRLDYKGYLKQQDIGTKGKILKTRFTHNGLNKPVNTLFVGTSPELELALYTVCFKLRPDRTCSVSLGNSKFGIVTYSWRYRGKSLIGSAYPEI